MRDRASGADGHLKSGLKLIGAKLGQTKDSGRRKIYACEPSGVVTYIEPFLGSANVLVGKRQHPVEVIGDINGYVVNFLRCFQNQPDKLFESIMDNVKRMEAGEAEFFHQIRKNPPTSNEHPMYSGTIEMLDLDWACWYYLVNKYCFNGIVRFNQKGECNSTYCGTTKGRGIYDTDWFSKVSDRLDGVHIHNLDYSFLLSYANGESSLVNTPEAKPESTWVVLDPPYFEVFTKYDQECFSIRDHELMKLTLERAKYRWLLTINDVPAIRELYKGFHMYEHGIFYSCSQTAAGRGVSAELIITNYAIDKNRISAITSTTGRS